MKKTKLNNLSDWKKWKNENKNHYPFLTDDLKPDFFPCLILDGCQFEFVYLSDFN